MSDDNKHNLPSLLGEIAGATDLNSALVIARDWGGRQVYIPSPQKLGEEHELAKLIGYEMALKLCQYFSGGGRGVSIQIPHGMFGNQKLIQRNIDNLVNDGLSHSDIAQKLKINIRTVSRQKRRKKTQMIVGTPFDKFFND